jgi:translocation and assembly module TamB
MRKRTVALAFLLAVLALVGGTVAVLSTPAAGERLCGYAAGRLAAATGQAVRTAACRIRPLTLRVEVDGLEVGPAGAPLLTVESASARLAPVQVLGRKVHLAEVSVVRPKLRFTVPERGGSAGCPRDVLSVVEVKRLAVVEGSALVTFPGGASLSVEGLDVSTRPSASALRALTGQLRRVRVNLAAGGVRLRTAHRDHLARLSAVGDVALDLSGADLRSLDLAVDGWRASASGRIQDLCAPRLDLAARGEGGMPELFRLIGVELDVAGKVAAEGRLTGRLASPIVAVASRFTGLRIGPFTGGVGHADVRVTDRDVVIDRIGLALGAGTAGGRVIIGFGNTVPIRADVDLRDVELGDVLDRFSIPGAWVSAKLDGKARLAGTLGPPLLKGTLSTEVRDLRALTGSYQSAGADPGVVAFRRGRLEAPIRIESDGLFFDAGRLEVGRGTVEVDSAVYFQVARGFSLAVRGEVDLDALGRVATVPWRGMARVELTGGAAPYGDPRLAGRVRATGFRFLDLDLGEATADVAYADSLLRLSRVEGQRNVTRWGGEAVVDLARSPAHLVSARYQAKGRLRDLLDGVMGYLPAARSVRDVMDGDVELNGTATGPADALDAEFDARLGAGTLGGRPYDAGRGVGRVHRGREVRVDSAELRRGGGVLRLKGTWGFQPPFPWDLTASLAGWRLADLGLPGGAWDGSASGTASLSGSREDPRVRLGATATGASVAGFAIGAVQAGGTVTGDRLVVTGGADGLRFQAEATLAGRMPFSARAELDLADAARLLPVGGAAGTVRATLRGEATAQGDLAEPGMARARVRLDRIQASWADFRVVADAPAVLEVSRGRAELAPVTFRGTNTELTLAGSRLPGGDLDASASGSLDVRLLAGLASAVRRPTGQLRLEAHVGGTLAAPRLVGSGHIDDVGFLVKGSNVAFSALRGDLAFSQNRILFDGLEAAVNGGRARLQGDVELDRQNPARLSIRAELDEVPLAVPAYLPTTLSGKVEVEGTPDLATLSGRIRVVRARYTEDVGLERALVELRRKPPPPPRAYDKSGEWLRLDLQLVADGDCRVDNDLVRGAIRGELLLTGTLASPGLLGTLTLRDGSRAVFRGNEFDLSRAVLEFTSRSKIEASLDAHGEAQVRDYQVFMHLFGSLGEPQLTLTSAPALSQPDIITLLSLGFTRRDAAAGGGVEAMATAAAAQALVSASGLDEQVRRFLPRGGVLRDFSVRITSAYSEGTGQVEPRAEFESWLLRDRLRLRYQAPLGAARGQRAQAELRLGTHTALQYQWENDNPDVATGDHGLDLKLRWEWNDR